MILGTFRANPHYLEATRLLAELHRIMRERRGESDDAEAVRNRLDVHWPHFNSEEVARLDGTSADLYTLEPDSPIQHPPTVDIDSREFGVDVSAAKARRDYEHVLELLRRRPESIAADRAALVRGFCYEKLGEDEISLLFFREAVRLSSELPFDILLSRTLR